MRTMLSKDLEAAKRIMRKEKASLVIVKDGALIYVGRRHGLLDLAEAVKLLGEALRGSAVADRVVGKAAATVFAYWSFNSVYGGLMSIHAAKILEKAGIAYEYDYMVPVIKGRKGEEICPFEKLVLGLDDVETAYRILARKLGIEGAGVELSI